MGEKVKTAQEGHRGSAKKKKGSRSATARPRAKNLNHDGHEEQLVRELDIRRARQSN